MPAPVTVTRKPSTIKAVQLATDVDMHTALSYVTGLGGNYSGMVQVQNTAGTMTWQLLINNATNNASAFANIGDYVIIENNALVSICKAADFPNLYQ